MPQQPKTNPFKNIRALHSGEAINTPVHITNEADAPNSLTEELNEPSRRTDGQTDVRPDGKKQGRSNKAGFQKLTVYIPDALYRRLKVRAATDDRDLYDIAEEAFETWFRRGGE